MRVQVRRTMPNFEKLAALGAQGVAGGAMVAWLAFLYVTRPGPTGGFTPVLHMCLAASTFMLFGWLALAHWWMGAQLKRGRVSIVG